MMADSETSWSKFAYETQSREIQETRSRIEDAHSRIATIEGRQNDLSENQVRMEERYKHTATHGDLANLETKMVKQIAESAAEQTEAMGKMLDAAERKRIEASKQSISKLDDLKASIDSDKADQKKLRDMILRCIWIGLTIALGLIGSGKIDWAAFAGAI